jgi:hypothetical protein
MNYRRGHLVEARFSTGTDIVQITEVLPNGRYRVRRAMSEPEAPIWGFQIVRRIDDPALETVFAVMKSSTPTCERVSLRSSAGAAPAPTNSWRRSLFPPAGATSLPLSPN